MKELQFLFAIITILTICSCASSSSTHAQMEKLEEYQFTEITDLLESEKRDIVVFLHAPWCHYCRNMEQTTFNDSEVIKLLNSSFYFISFNGEHQNDVLFKGQTYQYVPKGRTSGTHELASTLGKINGVLNYPTFLILSPELDITFKHNSFISNKEMLQILLASSGASSL